MAGFLATYRSSPGKLSRPHEEVAGASFILSCKKCHADEGIEKGCMDCHKEIRDQLDRDAGFHAFMMKGKKTECARCHMEHNGEEFQLINAVSWQGQDIQNFKHPHTDFKLVGKHGALKCEECHRKEGAKPFTMPEFPNRPRKNTFMGLSQDCVSCHKDVHAEGRVSDCAKCHNQAAWKPAPAFDHDKFYPLRNKHSGVACIKCHAVPRSAQVMKNPEWYPFGPVKGARCADCHSTPHRARWTESCDACHSKDASDWAAAAKKMTARQHAATGFRLGAPHHKADCAQCHEQGGPFAKKYPDPSVRGYNRGEKSCEGCHKDAHGGEFKEKYPRCIMCHRDSGFTPAKFGVKDHSVYPLKGGHAAVPCFMCHKPDASGKTKFTDTPKTCASCHADVHRKQFLENGATACEKCHASFASWKNLSFDHNKQSRFKLDDAHENVDCRQCHAKFKFPSGETVVIYKPVKQECKDCHAVTQK